MAFYYILKALDLPRGSEIVLPALTFWVVPELARVAGLKVVFADVDPLTFAMDPAALERALTPATRAVVPTHLYGLPCDMDAIMSIASRHNLHVIEDCAHSLGATFGGPVGTFGDASLFSFQTLKPLNCYGGGMAIVRSEAVAKTVRNLAEREPWPDQKRVENRLLVGRLQRIFIKPWVFSISAFPILWVSSLIGANPDVYLWEKIRSLDPLPDSYTERFPNVQAAIGLAALDRLEGWTEDTRRHARAMDEPLRDLRHQCRIVPAKGHTSITNASTDRSETNGGRLRRRGIILRPCMWTSAATDCSWPASSQELRARIALATVPVYSTDRRPSRACARGARC